MSEKVKLKKEQVSRIESWMEKFSKESIVKLYIEDPSRLEYTENGVIPITLDTIIRALYIGYEVEETPEESIRSYFQEQTRRMECRDGTDHTSAYAIQNVLKLLGITIEGVNNDHF